MKTDGSALAETEGDEGSRESGAPRRVFENLPTSAMVFWAVGTASGSFWTLWQWSKGHEMQHFAGFTDFFWTVLNAASDLQHGGLTHIYAGNGSILVALPGFTYLLVALIRLTSALGLSNPVEGLVFLHHGRSGVNYIYGAGWYVITPIAYGLSFAALFPLRALARRSGVTGFRLTVVMAAFTAALWWASVWWGHPEDGLALTFLVWAALRGLDGRWQSAGWFLGLGVAVQTLVVLGLPIMFAMAGVRRWVRMAVRVAVPGLVAIALPLFGDPHDTLRQILDQPTYPLNGAGHLTPWINVVPRPVPSVVYAGWPRSIGVALALLVAFLAVRRWGRGRSLTAMELVWVFGVSLSLRCLFESVIFPYYFVPPLLFLVLAAGSRSWVRCALGLAVATALGFLTTGHLGQWPFWILMTLGFGCLAVLGIPEETSAPGHELAAGVAETTLSDVVPT